MVTPISHLKSQILRQLINSRTCNFVGTTGHQRRLPVLNMKLLHQLLLFLCQKMCTCIKLFLMTTIDTMLFSVSFTEILMSYGSSIRSWTPEPGTPTGPTGTPEHRKNHLDEVQARFGTATHQEEDMCYLNVFFCCTVLYGL